MDQKVRYCPACGHDRIFDRWGREWFCSKCAARLPARRLRTAAVVVLASLASAAAVALYTAATR